ncbi:hypothetical protein Nepgr_011835 [Nepenthes gracilis]|uniref:DUF7138 domain-containing protein n=1 Tax=Nepenthes gracilis TaxID=150966 RepID=A0AAD3SG09_NEPGR|nr:hypothetical protein Nepgr_011835 [Nepenthes gracilis]
MMEDSTIGAFFSVIFFDGDREIDIGNVVVQPSMQFKTFQSMISQKIGISPHQITIYFEKSSSPSSFKSYRRIPITSKFNFASIVAERNCFFRVVLKRSRRVRRRPRKQIVEEDDSYSIHSDIISPENFLLLRRNHDSPFDAPTGFPVHEQIVRSDNWYTRSEYTDYANRMKFLEREKERYLTSLYLNSNAYSEIDIYSRRDERFGHERTSDDGAASSGWERSIVVCDLCMNANMEVDQTLPFHCCKYDAVTVGFRSPAGPIARQSKPGKEARKDI